MNVINETLFVRMSVRTVYFNDMNKVNYKVLTLLEHLNIRFHRNMKQLSMSLPNILHKTAKRFIKKRLFRI